MKPKILFLLLNFLSIALLAQKTELKYKLQDKETYRLKYISVESSTRTMQGMTQTTETKSTTIMSVMPVNQTPEFFIAQVKFDSMKISVNMPPMEVDSKNKGDINSEDAAEAMTAIINRMCRSDMIVKLDYSGKLLEFMNYDAFSQNILQGVDQLTGQVKMVVDMQVKNLVSKDMLIGMIESTLHYLPGKEVKKADSWKIEVDLPAGGLGMKTTTNFKLTQVKNNIATIEGKSVILPFSDEPVEMGGAIITSELQGMGELTYQVDIKTGMVLSGKYEYQRSGNMLVNAQGNNMEIPVESISEVIIEGM
jgi:hypothetical protein